MRPRRTDGCGLRASRGLVQADTERLEKQKRAGRLRVPPGIVCEVVNPANRDHAYLEGLDVRGLQALGTLGDFEFNRLAIIQRLVAISHDRGEMDENVLSTLALDESKSLAGIEPLHCSLFFTHCFYSFLLTAMRSYFESGRVGTVLVNELSGASTPNPSTELRAVFGRKKRPQV